MHKIQINTTLSKLNFPSHYLPIYSFKFVFVSPLLVYTMGDNTTEEKVSLKLLVNKETNKVLFAEAGKDFVDVLFSFLTLPLGTIARLAQKDSMIGPVTIGCLNTLHQSVADLDEGCLRAKKSKGFLLQPKNSSEDYCKTVKLNIDDTQPTEYFTCENFDTRLCRCFESSTPFIYYTCCECGKALNRPVSVEPFYEGFTNRVANFVVTDNLKVISNASHYTSLALVQNSGIKSISSVKEITINVTKEKVFIIFLCSFVILIIISFEKFLLISNRYWIY